MKQAWARIGISERSLQLRATAQEAKKQGGGFTPDELVHIRGKAGNDRAKRLPRPEAF
jgi:hypothetical protein